MFPPTTRVQRGLDFSIDDFVSPIFSAGGLPPTSWSRLHSLMRLGVDAVSHAYPGRAIAAPFERRGSSRIDLEKSESGRTGSPIADDLAERLPAPGTRANVGHFLQLTFRIFVL
jgi:hypothetical protein